MSDTRTGEGERVANGAPHHEVSSRADDQVVQHPLDELVPALEVHVAAAVGDATEEREGHLHTQHPKLSLFALQLQQAFFFDQLHAFADLASQPHDPLHTRRELACGLVVFVHQAALDGLTVTPGSRQFGELSMEQTELLPNGRAVDQHVSLEPGAVRRLHDPVPEVDRALAFRPPLTRLVDLFSMKVRKTIREHRRPPANPPAVVLAVEEQAESVSQGLQQLELEAFRIALLHVVAETPHRVHGVAEQVELLQGEDAKVAGIDRDRLLTVPQAKLVEPPVNHFCAHEALRLFGTMHPGQHLDDAPVDLELVVLEEAHSPIHACVKQHPTVP